MRKGAEAIEIILASGGTMGARMRAFDWSTSSLGDLSTWPPGLCSMISVCLSSQNPIAIYWGPDHVLLYNDAWIPILGKRHPWALGRSAREVWSEIWEILESKFRHVFRYGNSVSGQTEQFFVTRHGYIEESYFSYTFTPIRGENGDIAGIFTPVLETTQRVLGERRRSLLHHLAQTTAGSNSAKQASKAALKSLGNGSADIAFCMIYLVSDDGRSARLSSCVGFDAGSTVCPRTIELLDAGDPTPLWPLKNVFQTRQIEIIDNLQAKIDGLVPGGLWPEPARTAVVAPILDPSERKTTGFLIVGISPRRPFDESYRSFVELASEGVGRAIAVAHAHDREHTVLRARLDKFAVVAPVAIHEFRVAPDGTMSIPYSSPAITEIYGVTPEQLAENVFLVINATHPDDFRRAREAFAISRQTLKPVSAEWRVRHPTKGEIWVEVRSTPELEPDGTVVWHGYWHDITARKSMEEALREREARFRQLAENIQEFFWLTDSCKREFLYASPAYEAIWGRSCKSLQACPSDWMEGIHTDDRGRVAEAAQHQIEGTYDIEYRVVRPDGSVRFIHDRAFPIRNRMGTVYRIAGIAEDITSQKERENQIRFLAYHDALTKLPNRALLANRLRQAIAHSRHSKRALAVLFLDLDRFKTINDTLGHTAGDALLQQVAERLAQTLRTEDTVARAGGDEFLLLLSDLASAEDAGLTAERVLAALSAPFPLVGHTLRVSASIGISVSPRDAADVQSLIKYADAALYLAKEQGRNTFRFFSPDLDAKVRTRMHLENDLRCAVERQQFVLHYQPKIDLARRKIIGVEALIRWQHPENGLIPPSAFISVAEEMGLILPIGEWALRTACAQARAWRDDGVCDLRMEVNISSRQLHGIDIVATVKRILSETGCDPGLLGLEITESAVMTDPTEAIGIIRALHDMGIEIAIDDFGTGYSSLAYLKRFALNILKIDSTFVQGLPVDRDDVAIVQAIIALGHQFRLKVVAEGVETHAQKSFLTHHQCDAIQGFLISRALPSDEVRPLLQQTLAPCGLA